MRSRRDTGILSISLGLSANSKSLLLASMVVLSLVLKLKMQEINTKYGSPVFETSVTEGTLNSLYCFLINAITLVVLICSFR